MKRYKGWKLAVGVLMAVVGCSCGGCGKEDGQPTEQTAETKEGSAESADKEEAAAKEDTDTASTGTPETDKVADGARAEESTQGGGEAQSLEGVTVSILGDSISTFENWIPYGYNNFYPMSGDVTDINDTWWIRMFDETGMELCANASSAGSTCTGDSTDTGDPQVACDDFRITDLSDNNGAYPDIIVVFMGTNDLLESVPLGENDGTEFVEEGVIDNFADAYTLMLDKLENYYPCSEIYCCTLLQVGDYGTKMPYVSFVNGQGLTAEDYTEQIRLIAENKRFAVVDLYHCGIEIDNLHQMTSDGVHPNAEGMKYIADAVTGTIVNAWSR